MTPEFFKVQVARLQGRFGERAFDPEFVKLAWAEAKEMSEPAFRKAVDRWIGHKPYHQPPLLAEFRECRLAELREGLKVDCGAAAKALGWSTAKSMVLSSVFGTENAWEAVRRAKCRRRNPEESPDDCNL